MSDKQPTSITLRERIARKLNELVHSWNTDIKPYEECPDENEKYGKRTWLHYADEILADPDIKKGLELLKEEGERIKYYKSIISKPSTTHP